MDLVGRTRGRWGAARRADTTREYVTDTVIGNDVLLVNADTVDLPVGVRERAGVVVDVARAVGRAARGTVYRTSPVTA